MHIERIGTERIDEVVALRNELWPGAGATDHRTELAERIADVNAVVFAARADDGELAGMAEATIRHDYVNGCDTSPVAFLEGVYVRPGHRLHGIAAALSGAVEDWGRASGCTELGSDALLNNSVAHRFHEAIGFEERERVVCFRKRL